MIEKEVQKIFIVKLENRMQFIFLTFEHKYYLFNGNFLQQISDDEAIKLLNS